MNDYLTPIFYLVRDPAIASGMIGDAVAEGRISIPDDFPDEDADDLSNAIVDLVTELNKHGHYLTCNCTCRCDDAACRELEHRTCPWHQHHCPYEGE